MRAYVGLGSNLGDRLSNIRKAIGLLDRDDVQVVRVSSIYETDPIGAPQPDFLNAVCEIETALEAHDLLQVLKQVEAQIGRRPSERWGPREIDLDLLLYGDQEISDGSLVVPHPEMIHRAFVLIPLLEIAPGLGLPSGKPLESPGPSGVRFFSSG